MSKHDRESSKVSFNLKLEVKGDRSVVLISGHIKVFFKVLIITLSTCLFAASPLGNEMGHVLGSEVPSEISIRSENNENSRLVAGYD